MRVGGAGSAFTTGPAGAESVGAADGALAAPGGRRGLLLTAAAVPQDRSRRSRRFGWSAMRPVRAQDFAGTRARAVAARLGARQAVCRSAAAALTIREDCGIVRRAGAIGDARPSRAAVVTAAKISPEQSAARSLPSRAARLSAQAAAAPQRSTEPQFARARPALRPFRAAARKAARDRAPARAPSRSRVQAARSAPPASQTAERPRPKMSARATGRNRGRGSRRRRRRRDLRLRPLRRGCRRCICDGGRRRRGGRQRLLGRRRRRLRHGGRRRRPGRRFDRDSRPSPGRPSRPSPRAKRPIRVAAAAAAHATPMRPIKSSRPRAAAPAV